MRLNFQRRHSRWYELLIFNSICQLIFGLAIIVAAPQFILIMHHGGIVQAHIPTFYLNASAFTLTFAVTHQIQSYPGARSLQVFLALPLLAWGSAMVVVWLLPAKFSVIAVGYSFLAALIWAWGSYSLAQRYGKLKLAIVPHGRAKQLIGNLKVNAFALTQPDLGDRRYDAVVADLHCADLGPDWEKFLAECALAHIPVLHFKQIEEAITGQVRIEHLAENDFGNLLPSGFYLGVKRCYDFAAAIVLLPLLLPVMLVTALCIKLDSSGSIFFVQQRMGYRGQPFNVYKFRSMNQGIVGKSFTENSLDPRITRVGHVIRRYRIDELPQLLNVLKGEMSFIGPRPESIELSQWYEKDVPFFSYRHVVRPGISGWAQVNQGYAAEIDGMTQKLQYDFYYIKHFSIWLDILIVFKTIRTVLTGFGAR